MIKGFLCNSYQGSPLLYGISLRYSLSLISFLPWQIQKIVMVPPFPLLINLPKWNPLCFFEWQMLVARLVFSPSSGFELRTSNSFSLPHLLFISKLSVIPIGLLALLLEDLSQDTASSWWSKKQAIVSHCSSEAECRALAASLGYSGWLIYVEIFRLLPLLQLFCTVTANSPVILLQIQPLTSLLSILKSVVTLFARNSKQNSFD